MFLSMILCASAPSTGALVEVWDEICVARISASGGGHLDVTLGHRPSDIRRATLVRARQDQQRHDLRRTVSAVVVMVVSTGAVGDHVM